MNSNYKKNMMDILNIIGYENDKGAYADNFFKSCIALAIANLAKLLPEGKQKELAEEHLDENAESISKLVQKYWTDEDYNKAVEEATKENFTDFINTVSATLSEEQIKNLQDHLNTLKTA